MKSKRKANVKITVQNGQRRNGGSRRRRNTRKSGKSKSRRIGMSDAGMAFLKCAFAPPDFSVDPGKGIPDSFQGKSFMDKNSIVQPINPVAGNDTYYVFMPTPGIAYWSASVASGTPISAITSLTPTYWPGNFGAGNIFGDVTAVGDFAKNVQSFRYASQCAGLYPTSPFTGTAGSITVWKTNLKLTSEVVTRTYATTPAVVIDANYPAISGLEALTTVSRDHFAQGCQQGTYFTCVNNQPEFDFRPIMEGIATLPDVLTNTYMFGRLSGPILGLGDIETAIVKVSVPAGATTSFMLRAWACIEYTPTAGNIYDRFSRPSPALDPIALEAYRRLALQIPVAVVAAENANFWKMVLGLLQQGARIGSYMPGPVGVISSAADVLLSGMKGLLAERERS